MYFFCNEFLIISRWPGNVPKNSRNWGNLIDLDLLLPKNPKNSPPLAGLRLWAKTKNVCDYPPPPLNLPGLRRSRKISATTPPPHRIWSASGDHGKLLAPPKKKSWLRRWYKRNIVTIMKCTQTPLYKMNACRCHWIYSILSTIGNVKFTVSDGLWSVNLTITWHTIPPAVISEHVKSI